MFCPECGQELDSNNNCQNPNCISKMQSENENIQFKSNPETLNNNFNNDNHSDQNSNAEFRDAHNISPTEMLEFIGHGNTGYYMDKWTRFQNNPKFISWNWPAFLFGLFWFWFRKMYNIAGILFAVGLANGILLSDFKWLRSIVSLVIIIGSGLLGNQLYMAHATKKIKSAKFNMGFNDDMLFRTLRSTGGRTWVPLIVAIVLILILIILFVIGFMALNGAFGDFRYLRY